MYILGLIWVPTWLLVCVFLALTLYFLTARKHGVFIYHRIPGPKPLPFVGCLPLLMKKGVMVCEYEGTMKYGKCFGYFLGNIPTIWTTDTEIIKEVFVKQFTTNPSRSQAVYVSSFWQKTVLFSEVHDHWKLLRSVMSPSFTSGKLKKMDSMILSNIDSMIANLQDSLNSSEVIDMCPIFKALTLNVICSTALGVDSQSGGNAELQKQASNLINFSIEKNPLMLLHFLIPDIKHICKLFDVDYNNRKAVQYIAQSLQSVIKDRQNDPSSDRRDLLQLMINSQKELEKAQDQKANGDIPSRGMTDDEIIANAITFLFAGYDTTATAMIFASYFLATQQDCQEKLWLEINDAIGDDDPTYEKVQELEYLEMFLSEAKRLYPPVTRINRQLQKPVTVNGYNLPAVSLTVPVYTIHRMPEYWPDPLKFDPDRFSPENKANIVPYTYVPFGAGPRNCVGMRFAQMELKMTIVRLIQRFVLKPSAELHVPPILEKNVFCRPRGGMKLILEPRSECD